MKTRKTIVCGLFAVILIFAACKPEPEPNPAHTHQWGGWSETAATIAGNETRVCRLDKTHTETRTAMVSVAGGSFEMGNPDPSIGYDDERPVCTVTLAGFYMGKYEVTQAQWYAVMGKTIEDMQALATIPSTTDYGREAAYPIYYVNWYETLVFCNKLSVMEGLTPAYRILNSTNPDDWEAPPTSSNATWDAVTIDSNANGYRLPTEAQWEYAAKGGNGSPGNYIYAGSNYPDEVAWYSDNMVSSGSRAKQIGTKAPNGLSLYDMSGNVSEWCWNWYDEDYTEEPKTDPMGPSSGDGRVHRGGGWDQGDEYARSTVRSTHDPYKRYLFLGFRLARPQ